MIVDFQTNIFFILIGLKRKIVCVANNSITNNVMKWLFYWNSPNSTEVNTESDLGDLKLPQMIFYDLSSLRYKNEASGKPAS